MFQNKKVDAQEFLVKHQCLTILIRSVQPTPFVQFDNFSLLLQRLTYLKTVADMSLILSLTDYLVTHSTLSFLKWYFLYLQTAKVYGSERGISPDTDIDKCNTVIQAPFIENRKKMSLLGHDLAQPKIDV